MHKFSRKKRKPTEQKWLITLKGRDIGTLVDYRYLEMFWGSYLVESNSDECYEILRDKSHWEECLFTFVHSDTQKVSENAMCGQDYMVFCSGRSDRISMRGLRGVEKNRLGDFI